MRDVISELKGYLEPLEQDLNRNIEYKKQEKKNLNNLRERAIVLETLKVLGLALGSPQQPSALSLSHTCLLSLSSSVALQRHSSRKLRG